MGRESSCTVWRLVNIGLTLALLGAGGYVLWYFLGQPSGQDIADTLGNIDFGDFTNVLDNFTGFDVWNADPFVGDNTTNLWTGYTSGVGGLSLTIWNALDDTWQTEYAEAVGNWENCNPDALTLTSTRVDVDNTCTQVDGLMKVCNGNYGDTGWLGINEILKTVNGGVIQSSTAKMNEYYLNKANYNSRLYTMCHEVGHGFGLPHTDENFNNKDLGNCLDYTNHPENNLLPGYYNCNRLAGMYGTVSRRRNLELRGQTSSTASQPTGDASSVPGEQSHQRQDRSLVNMEDPQFATEYDMAMEELKYEIAKSSDGSMEFDGQSDPTDERQERGWRALRDHPLGGAFVRRLNEDLVLEVHVLYPSFTSDWDENDLN